MAALTEDLVEEILLRVPPDEPAHLIRAAAICRPWLRILTAGGIFRRRYRRLHRTPPLLGYIHNVRFYGVPKFVPTTASSPPPTSPPMAAGHYSGRALDCRHGRVLIHDTGRVLVHDAAPLAGLLVWDPITGDRHQVSFPPSHHDQDFCSFAGAVLCARHGCGGCDHLDCHDGPFLVVYVGIMVHVAHTWTTVYSSETGAWSSAQVFSSSSNNDNSYWKFNSLKPSILIGDAIYFGIMCPRLRILKYDLGGHGWLSMVDAPKLLGKVAPIDIDGRLGLVEYHRNCIYTWSRQADGVGGGWVWHNVAELETLIPTRRYSLYRDRLHDVIRFREGTDTVIFSLDNNIDRGVFTLDLKSRRVRKVSKRWDYDILPYMSFYTPDFVKGKLSLS